jgi:hypothetical protein
MRWTSTKGVARETSSGGPPAVKKNTRNTLMLVGLFAVLFVAGVLSLAFLDYPSRTLIVGIGLGGVLGHVIREMRGNG